MAGRWHPSDGSFRRWRVITQIFIVRVTCPVPFFALVGGWQPEGGRGDGNLDCGGSTMSLSLSEGGSKGSVAPDW